MKKSLFVLIVIASVSCKKDSAPSSIHAPLVSSNATTQIKFDVDIPVDFTRFIPCTNESVHFTGQLVGRVHLAEDAEGSHLHVHANTQLHYQQMHGIGLATGNEYHFISRRTDVANFHGNESQHGTFHVTDRLLVTTPGGGNNFVMLVAVSLVINGNNEVILSKQEEDVSCQ